MKIRAAYLLTIMWIGLFVYACVVFYVAEKRHEQDSFTTTEVVWNGD